MEDEPRFSTLGLLGRFVDEAWPARLTPTQAMVWVCLLRRAGRDPARPENLGKAWPSAKTLAGYIGHKGTVRVRTAKRELVEMGLLSVIEAGGGTGRSAKYIVQLPPLSGANSASDAKSESDAESVNEQVPNPTSTGAKSEREQVPIQHSKGVKKEIKKESIKGEAARIDLVEPPVVLQTEEFANAWRGWIDHRKAVTGRPIPPTSQHEQLVDLARLTSQQATQAVREAIAGNYAKPYTDRIKTDERTKRTSREHPEPNLRHLIPGYTRATQGQT